MKRSFVHVMMVVFFVLCITGPVSADLNNGLVAYYPFNGTARDASGHGFHGTQHSGVDFAASDRFGSVDHAVGLDGTNDYITAPAIQFGANDFSINLTAGPEGMSGYSWSGPNGWTSIEQNPQIPAATAAMAGTYTVTVTDANNCVDSADTDVQVGLPRIFNQLLPLDGATDQTTFLTLEWEACPNVETYELYFGTISPPPLYQSGLVDHNFDLTGLSGGTMNYWLVRAVNRCGTVDALGGEWDFTTTTHPMEVPSLNAFWSNPDVILSWSKTCGVAMTYTIYEGNLDELQSTGVYNHYSIDFWDEGANLTEKISSASNNTYYLIVPKTSGAIEGSYGFDRPQGFDYAVCEIYGFLPENCP